MKKVVYKLLVGFLFSIFGMLAKLLFASEPIAVNELFISKEFWTNYMIFFAIGYVVLGNILWMTAQKNKQE